MLIVEKCLFAGFKVVVGAGCFWLCCMFFHPSSAACFWMVSCWAVVSRWCRLCV